MLHSDFRLSYAEGNKPNKKSCSTPNPNQFKGEDKVTGVEQRIHNIEEQLKQNPVTNVTKKPGFSQGPC